MCLEQALAQRSLRPEDLLRLRMFVVDLDMREQLEGMLEKLLPRHRWPVITIVELSAGALDEQAPLLLDAIAAPAGRRVAPHIDRIDNVEAKQHAPEVVRYGPWVFLGAIVGESAHRLSRSQRIEAQSRSIFAHMEQLLCSTGANLGDVLDVGGWLAFPMSEYEPLGRVRSQLLAQRRLLPASAAVQVGHVGRDGELLSFEAIAFAPEGGLESRCTSETMRSPSLNDPRKRSPAARDLARPSPLAAYYAMARCAGDYVFTCGEIPRIDAGRDAKEQARDVYEQLTSHLNEHGASLSDVVHQTVFVRHREDMPAVQAVASSFCASPTPTTLILAADMGFRPGVDVEIKLIAKSEEREGRQEEREGRQVEREGRRAV